MCYIDKNKLKLDTFKKLIKLMTTAIETIDDV